MYEARKKKEKRREREKEEAVIAEEKEARRKEKKGTVSYCGIFKSRESFGVQDTNQKCGSYSR